ncbi:MAG: TIR domain-containing protein [Desulfovibrio sp.]|jgi:hypothetical protein|nr:TIR domain-containing protein [Desulfovibrio sp.]
MVESLIAPFDAYKGDEPYIFVSYAHKNSEIVFEHITRLRNAGFRIWYDEGIDPGADWSDEIANALSNADVFLVFISPAAVESHNVKKEIVFAIDQRKPMLCIHIENTELPIGLKMQLGNIQSLLEDRFHDQEKFYARLFDALPEETRGADRDGVPVPTASGKAKRRTTQGASGWGKYRKAVAGSVLVAVVALTAILAVTCTRHDVPSPSSQGTVQVSEIVTFADANLEKALREELNKTRGSITTADLADITGTLQLAGRGISDITPLRHMKRLILLNLENNRITNISALQGLTELTALGLVDNKIKDISPLRTLKKLTVLTLDNNPVSAIEPLVALKNLEVLSLEGIALQVKDLEFGKYLRRLKSLTVNDATFANFSKDQIHSFKVDLPPNCEVIMGNSTDKNKGRQ